MKKVCLLFVFLCLSIIGVSAQTIGEIRFEGLKQTNQNYLLKVAGISVGGNWNNSIKSSVVSKLTALDKIVEKVEITESQGEDDTVIVTINIQEKYSFLVVPFFTYGNKAGIKPRVIFRNYNLGGYGK
jgi:outer membrane protein assembly factor BamA